MKGTVYLLTGATGFLGGEICRQLVAAGKKVRAFALPSDKSVCYISEEAEGLAKAAGIKPIKLFVPISLVQVAARVADKPLKALGKDTLFSPFIVYNLARNNAFDSTKAKTELGYTVRPFSETIKDCVDWLRETGKI